MGARREFLGWFGASAVLAASGSRLEALEPAPDASAVVDRRGAAMEAEAMDVKWDVTWVDRITGKHRAVFDSPELAEGMALWRACMWRDQYKEIYGTEPADMSPVLVIRHSAIDMAMNDAYWSQFSIGKEAKLRNQQTKKWETANPFRATPADAPPQYAAYSLEGFMASGGVILACNLAFRQVVWRYREAEKLSREAAEARALEHLIPGVILQPSGIFAALRAQEAGCGYIFAS